MTFRQILAAAAASAILAIGSAGAASAVEYDANHKIIVKKEVVVKRPVTVKRPIIVKRPVIEVRRPAVGRVVVNPNTYRVVRPGVRRPYIVRERVYEILKAKHYRTIGAPYIYGGKYLIRSYDARGRLVIVTIDPYTGAWLSERGDSALSPVRASSSRRRAR